MDETVQADEKAQAGNTMCHADFPCAADPDEPCFCPFIGPRRRRYKVRYSARATAQMRSLSGDPRWPLRAVSSPSGEEVLHG